MNAVSEIRRHPFTFLYGFTLYSTFTIFAHFHEKLSLTPFVALRNYKLSLIGIQPAHFHLHLPWRCSTLQPRARFLLFKYPPSSRWPRDPLLGWPRHCESCASYGRWALREESPKATTGPPALAKAIQLRQQMRLFATDSEHSSLVCML